MSAVSLIAPSVVSLMARLFRVGGDQLTALIVSAGHGVPPPVPADVVADDIETRLMVALICAAHF